MFQKIKSKYQILGMDLETLQRDVAGKYRNEQEFHN
jgi:hypothetical protein